VAFASTRGKAIIGPNQSGLHRVSAEIKKEIQLEIAHVLFIDIVGYSKLSINQQRAVIDELKPALIRSVIYSPL